MVGAIPLLKELLLKELLLKVCYHGAGRGTQRGPDPGG
jgi:hypothetical protein